MKSMRIIRQLRNQFEQNPTEDVLKLTIDEMLEFWDELQKPIKRDYARRVLNGNLIFKGKRIIIDDPEDDKRWDKIYKEIGWKR